MFYLYSCDPIFLPFENAKGENTNEKTSRKTVEMASATERKPRIRLELLVDERWMEGYHELMVCLPFFSPPLLGRLWD